MENVSLNMSDEEDNIPTQSNKSQDKEAMPGTNALVSIGPTIEHIQKMRYLEMEDPITLCKIEPLSVKKHMDESQRSDYK